MGFVSQIARWWRLPCYLTTTSATSFFLTRVDRVNLEIQQAERDYDLNCAAELKYGSLMTLQRQLEAAEQALDEYQSTGKSMLREEVTGSDKAEIVSKWTGISISKLQQSEKDKLLHLNDELHKCVYSVDSEAGLFDHGKNNGVPKIVVMMLEDASFGDSIKPPILMVVAKR